MTSRRRQGWCGGRWSAAFVVCLFISTLAVAQGWEYDAQSDKLTGAPMRQAAIRSTNSLSLPPPFEGENRGTLVIRQRERDELNVLFSVEKGELACGYGNCSVVVRFDERAPTRFTASKTGDLSSNLLSINNQARFVEQAANARTIRVSVTMIQGGAQVLEFATPQALTWTAPPAQVEAPVRTAPRSRAVTDSLTTTQQAATACDRAAAGRSGDDRKNFIRNCLKSGAKIQ